MMSCKTALPNMYKHFKMDLKMAVMMTETRMHIYTRSLSPLFILMQFLALFVNFPSVVHHFYYLCVSMPLLFLPHYNICVMKDSIKFVHIHYFLISPFFVAFHLTHAHIYICMCVQTHTHTLSPPPPYYFSVTHFYNLFFLFLLLYLCNSSTTRHMFLSLYHALAFQHLV